MPMPSTYLRAQLNFDRPTTGAVATCVLWYLPESMGTLPTLAIITAQCNSFMTAYTAGASDALVEFSRLASVRLTWVQGTTEVDGQSTMAAIDGQGAGEMLPEEDVLCIVKRTGLKGRENRGRIFWPFVPESFVEDGQLVNTGVPAAAQLAGMVKSDVVAGTITWKPQHLNRKTGVLVPIVQSGYNNQTCSRRDRRHPRALVQIRV